MNKLLFIATASALFSFGVSADGSAIYEKSCKACHEVGMAGAPKRGVKEDWEPRLAKGMNIILASVKTGMNVMPPKGMCSECSDSELKSAIEFMIQQKQ